MASRPDKVAIIGPAPTGPLKPGETYDAVLQLRDHLDRDKHRAGVTLTLTAAWLSTGNPSTPR